MDFKIDGNNIEASDMREILLASSYAAVVKNLKTNNSVYIITEYINKIFKTDFSVSEVGQFMDKNRFHEDFETESRKHQYLNYGESAII